MKSGITFLFGLICALALLGACVTGGGGAGGLSLRDAIEQSAEQMAAQLPAGSRVAVTAFESEKESLSAFILAELSSALTQFKVDVVPRHSMEYVVREQNFQMSGYVSDESALGIGHFLAADHVVTGQMLRLGNTYRFSAAAIHVEKGVQASALRFDVRDDQTLRNMIAALDSQTLVAATANYQVNEARPQTTGAFIDRGIYYAMQGDYEAAIADFTEVIRLDPNLASAYTLRARALVASVVEITDLGENFSSISGNFTQGLVTEEKNRIYDRAINDLTQAIRLDPDNAIVYVERGVAYRGKGDNDRAIEDFNQAIRLDPNSTRAYFNRGSAYRNKGDNERAIEDFNQAIRIDPNYSITYLTRGDVYRNKGDNDRAIEDFNQAIRIDNNPMAYMVRGVVYRAKGDNDRAIEDYTQAIRYNPNYTRAYFNRGNAYRDMGDNDRAIEDYTQALRLDPNYATAYAGRGNAYYNKADYDRAITDYTEAIRLDPNFAMAYNNRGHAYFIKGDYDRAIADYNQAIRFDPDYTQAYINRGVLYQNNSDYDRAIEDYNQVILLDPNHFWAYNNRGNAYYSKADYDRAIVDYTEALRLDPNYTSAYNSRGNAYYVKGDYERAIADYEAALRLDPDNAHATQWLEEARQRR